MLKTKNTTKLTSILLAAVILIAIGVLIYVNLPRDSTPTPDDQTPSGNETKIPIFTVTYTIQENNYTLEEIEVLPSYTGQGGYRTAFPSIRGIGNYTGVPVTTIVYELNETLQNYSIQIFSSNQTNKTYNYSAILGNVDIYNPENASDEQPIGYGGLSMILCYKYEGAYLNESKDGILKIAFVDQNGSITSSSLWWKYVVSMKIIPEETP